MRSMTVALPIFAGLLLAQDHIRTETTRTTWNGVLVDANCQTTRTERKEYNNADRTTKTTHTETVDCPVTSATNSFGLLTEDGRYIRFDNSSNSRVVEIVKSNHRYLADRTPMKVRMIGTSMGDVAVVESLDPQVAVVETSNAPGDAMFDVRYHDDRGKLIVTSRGVNFENISNAKHSRSWTYSQIKELKRDGKEIKIDGYSSDSFEFKLEGKEMSNEVYRTIADRIVAARGR